MLKKIFALILIATLLAFVVSCDDEELSGGFEIDVSSGGFFDDVADTTDESSSDTTESISDTTEVPSDSTEEADTSVDEK